MRAGDTVSAATEVHATPQHVYALVSDVRRIPEWSPECRRCERLDGDRFRGWNRRRLGRWSTTARIDTADPGREFAFVVEVGGADFARWSYRIAPPDRPDRCLLTEEVRLCRDLSRAVLLYERLFLGVRDRRADLRGNLDASLRRIRALAESSISDYSGPQ